MKKWLVLLVFLFTGFSCGTNKPVSDTQKEKIIGEVKEVFNTFLKGAQQANSDMIMETLLNSPDFVYAPSSGIFNYEQFADIAKTVLGTLQNQEGNTSDEKFAVLDKTTVLLTANSKWVMNFKDGTSLLQDPWTMQFLFKKVNNEWKVLSVNESGIEKSIPGETTKALNQVELMGQLEGFWQSPVGKDTIEFWDCQTYGKSFTANVYQVVKGQKVPVYVSSSCFDSKEGTFKGFTQWYNGDYSTWIGLFSSENVFSGNLVWDFRSTMPWGKFRIEFVNPKEFIWNFFNQEGVKTSEMIFKRVK